MNNNQIATIITPLARRGIDIIGSIPTGIILTKYSWWYKMKKIHFAVSLILIIYEITACKSVTVPSSFEPSTMPFIVDQTKTCSPIDINKAEDMNGITFYDDVRITTGVYTVSYGLVDINIVFPQLDGFHDEIIEDKVNELIFNSVITHAEMNWERFRYEVNIIFEITYYSRRYISIVFSGEKGNSRYNSYRKALTIDLETGERVWLAEFFTVEEVLSVIKSLVLTEKCEIKSEMFSDLSGAKELIFELCIDHFGEIKDYSWGNGFYLRGDKLGLIIPVTDAEHVSVEFEISIIPWG